MNSPQETMNRTNGANLACEARQFVSLCVLDSCSSPITHHPSHSHSCPSPITHHPSHSSAGFTLVAALFLIVVVAALGAFAVRISASQQQTVNLALLSTRALSAANSGIEFGAYRALNASSCASATLNLTEAGLNGFTVAVTCAASAHTESGGTVNIYRIDATASAGNYGQPDFVSRHVYATFASVP